MFWHIHKQALIEWYTGRLHHEAHKYAEHGLSNIFQFTGSATRQQVTPSLHKHKQNYFKPLCCRMYATY